MSFIQSHQFAYFNSTFSPQRVQLCALSSLLALLFLTTDCYSLPSEKGGNGWTIELGFGAELESQYAGSDNRQLEPDPYINIAYRNGPTLWYTSIVDYGMYHSLTERWLVGLSAGLEVGRDEDDDQALAGLGQIDNTWELRLDLAFRASENLTLAARGMTAGAQKDNVYFIAALYDIPIISDRLELSLRSDISWGTRKHLQTEFGVSQQQADTSGYPVYLPDAGLKSIGAAVSGKYWITPKLFGFAEVAYERYDKAGADSPYAVNDYDVEAEIGIAYRL